MKKVEINLKPLINFFQGNFAHILNFKFFISLLLVFFWMMFSVYDIFAKCPENVVPNFLDPNCELNDRLTIGFLINRLLSVLPYILFLAFGGMFLWGIVTIGTAGTNSEKVKEGQKIIINAVIALVIFLSLGAIIFLISYITGVDLLSWLGVD